jgi:outer membrane protein OmpA-like peptidoglycan-associated protein/opacity protein-like surface antigen
MKSRSHVSLYAAWILALLVALPLLPHNTHTTALAQTPPPSSAKPDTVDASALKLNFLEDIMADADKPLYIRYGIFGGITMNLHNANFSDFANYVIESNPIPSGLGKTGTNIISYSFGGLFEYPIIDRFGFAVRASFSNVGGFVLQGQENYYVANPSGGGFSLPILHTLTINNLLLLAGEPYLTYRILDGMTVYAGARIGYFLNPSYVYEQKISPDASVRFLGGTANGTVWNHREGLIPEVNALNAGLMAGLSYEIPLDPGVGKWLAAVEGFYTFGLTKVANGLVLWQPNDSNAYGQPVTRTVQQNELGTDKDPASLAWPHKIVDGTWSFNNIRAGVSLRYSPFRTIRPELTPAMQETFKQIKKIDSAIAQERIQNKKRLAQVDSINTAIAKKVEELKKVGISVNITKVTGIDESGKEIPGKAKLIVEQFRKSVTQPILPAIFFDEGSFTIPSKYRRLKAADRGTFKMADLAGKSNYEIYRHTLNIIGKRMEENPAAVLFVTGCNANVGVEQGNQKISEQRAQAISDYLQDVWKVQAKRIIIQKRDLPEVPSNSAEPTGAAENRRVDLSSTLPELMAPVVSDVIAKIPNPPTVRFGIEINAGAGLKQWNFEVTQFQDDEVATVFQRTGTNTYPQQLDWNLAQEANTVPSSGQDLTVQLSMTDINNKTGDAPLTAIPVEQINVQKKELEGKGDKRIDWFDIIGFTGGASPALDEVNQKTIESIKAKLKPDAVVTINSYTDNTGDATQNKQLAQKRADFIAKALGLANAKINAVGPTTLHDNNNPEGRMYNRLVRVELVTPTK